MRLWPGSKVLQLSGIALLTRQRKQTAHGFEILQPELRQLSQMPPKALKTH